MFGGTPNALLASAKAEQKRNNSYGKIKMKTTPVTLANSSPQSALKSPTIEFCFCADYLAVFVLNFFERVFNCLLLLLDNGVA